MKHESSLYGHLARVFVPGALSAGQPVALDSNQIRYLKAVLRKKPGDPVRIFNGRDGEWQAVLSALSKSGGEAVPKILLRPQPDSCSARRLFFAPLKKSAMDVLIEKGVELGATDFHPVLTDRTIVRAINTARLAAHIAEAAEQCERMDIPVLHPVVSLEALVSQIQDRVFWCSERSDAPFLRPEGGMLSFLIGPEGGFTEAEAQRLSTHPRIVPVSLGPRILRAETAALACLSLALSP